MKTLQQCKWGRFKIEDIFDIKGSYTTHPSLLKENGLTPRITCSAANNGLDNFYDNEPTEEGNVLTVDSATIGFISYQESNFIATDHVEKLVFKGNTKFNRYIGLFLKECIDNSKDNKFGYGYKLSQIRIKRQIIMLPVTATGEPDYEFMEQYMKEKEEIILGKYHSYISGKIKELGSDENLKPYQWKAFRIGKIFTDIQRGKRLKTGDHIAGQTPYVSSSAIDNGIDGFIGNDKGVRKFEDCLTLANSGSVGATYYQPFQFIASDHVTKLKRPFINKYVYLFLAVMVGKLGENYSFNREINDSRLQREYIMLPANHEGEPDYEYMEKKMRHIEHIKLLQYIQNKIDSAK